MQFATLNTVGDLTRLTLRRAPLNFLNLDMLTEIQRLLESMGERPPGRVLVIDSEGAAFSAGFDVSEQTGGPVFLLLDEFHTIMHTLCSFPRPTIALVRGVALGAGNELAAACDFILASNQATFGQPEIKVGSIPTLAPLLLPSRIGIQRTLQMILTGSAVDAQEAERIGLIYRTVPEDGLEAALTELAGSLATSSTAVMEIALRAARGPRLRELENNVRAAQALYLNELMDLNDPVEGVRAFLDRRPPQWKDR
jgi:cyclohexa-1,5-dienecarbonyl-CoA hydratase